MSDGFAAVCVESAPGAESTAGLSARVSELAGRLAELTSSLCDGARTVEDGTREISSDVRSLEDRVEGFRHSSSTAIAATREASDVAERSKETIVQLGRAASLIGKTLAGQAASATESIRGLVRKIQTTTGEVVGAISQFATTNARVEASVRGIADASDRDGGGLARKGIGEAAERAAAEFARVTEEARRTSEDLLATIRTPD